MPEKRFYRPDELARDAGVSMGTIYRLMRLGLIVHVHVGRAARIPKDEFIRILKGGLDLTKKNTPA